MKDLIIITLIIIIAACCITGCSNDDTEDYYWCEYHKEYHCCHTNCNKVKHCGEHNGYFTYPDHWVNHRHHTNY